MAVFALSFRLGDGPNYSERWAAVDAAIRSRALGAVYDETTSFYVLQSFASATALCGSVFAEARMSHNHDTLVVIDLSTKDHQMMGSKTPNLLNTLLASR